MKKLILLALLVLPLTISAQKFGHFNSADIIQLMPEYKSAQTELQKLQTQYETDLKSMQDELKSKATAYDQARDSLPNNIRERREQELQELSNRIQTTFNDNQQSLQKTSNEKMQAIADKVKAAVKSIGEAGGYVYIMDTTSGIPFISTTLSKDITAELKSKLGL